MRISIKKILVHIDVNWLRPYLDRKFWRLITTDSSVLEVISYTYEDQIGKYYPSLAEDRKEKLSPAVFNIIQHRFSKYMYEVNGALLEPDFGWIIVGFRKIFKFSFPMVEDPWDSEKPRPSLLRFVFRRVKVIDRGITVRYAWQNYYHFIIDTIPQIKIIDEMGIDRDVPVIVPYFFNEIPYIDGFKTLTQFTDRKIITQAKGDYFRVSKLLVAKDTFFSTSILSLRTRVLSKGLCISGPKKIFVTRSRKYQRTISNLEEIEDIARSDGFVIIEGASMTIQDQINTFRSANSIVGIHGAGLTNLIFCGDPDVKIMEIFPGGGLAPEHYKNIAILLGISYSSCEGSGIGVNLEFYLNPVIFRQALKDI